MTNDDIRPRRSNGSWEREYNQQMFLNAIDKLEDPTTTNIADEIGCGTGTAHRYLCGLADEDRITREKRFGAVLWDISE